MKVFRSFRDAEGDKQDLTCRTEKDRTVRLNHRTAGLGFFFFNCET